MDIAKYIGLYLLKNNFCYLHGLGNLQIHKKPAVQEGDTLAAPRYEVVLVPSGSIDDSLANFIATAEQTSISKSSNEIRNFVEAARADLAAGKQVPIPGIGHFVSQNGKTAFVADPNLAYAPPAIPILKMSKRLDEPPSFRRDADEDVSVSSGGNKQRMLLIILAVAAVIGLVVLAIRYMNKPVEEVPVEAAPQATPVTPPTVLPDTTAAQVTDTTGLAPAAIATPAPVNSGTAQIVLRSYPTQAAAEKRRRTLQSTPLGETVSVVAQDSTHFLVVIPYTAALPDSTRVLDSLSRVYGSKATLRR
jgi:nucleoid DNA-binding protein